MIRVIQAGSLDTVNREEDVEAGEFTTGTASSLNIIKDINGMQQDK
jgi:hypothetical protein